MPTQLPQRGTAPQFSAHVCCGQTAGWIKMPLGTEVGVGSGHIVLDGSQLPPPKKKRIGGTAPTFRPMHCLLWPNSWMNQEDATCYGGRPRPRRHCDRWRPSSPQKGHPCLLWTKRSPISATAEQLYIWLETYDFALVAKSIYKYIEPFQVLVYK